MTNSFSVLSFLFIYKKRGGWTKHILSLLQVLSLRLFCGSEIRALCAKSTHPQRGTKSMNPVPLLLGWSSTALQQLEPGILKHRPAEPLRVIMGLIRSMNLQTHKPYSYKQHFVYKYHVNFCNIPWISKIPPNVDNPQTVKKSLNFSEDKCRNLCSQHYCIWILINELSPGCSYRKLMKFRTQVRSSVTVILTIGESSTDQWQKNHIPMTTGQYLS